MPVVTEDFSGPIPGYSFSHFLGLPNGYLGPECHSPGAGSLNTNLTPRYVPIRLSRRHRISAMAVEVTALGSDTNEVTLFGLYAHDFDKGGPGALVKDFGVILTGTGLTGIRETPAAIPGIDLDAGLYWMCEVTNSPSVGTLFARRNFAASSAYQWAKSSPLGFSVIVGYIGTSLTIATFALPNPAAISGTTGGGGRLLLKGIGL
jgi:hypothetical protein